MTNLSFNTVSDISRSKFGFHLIEVLETENWIFQRTIKTCTAILIERKFLRELESWLRQFEQMRL